MGAGVDLPAGGGRLGLATVRTEEPSVLSLRCLGSWPCAVSLNVPENLAQDSPPASIELKGLNSQSRPAAGEAAFTQAFPLESVQSWSEARAQPVRGWRPEPEGPLLAASDYSLLPLPLPSGQEMSSDAQRKPCS